MPYKSDAQRRYFNANREELEEQGVDVDEWNESSKGKKLPEKVKEEKKAFAPMINNMAQWMRQNFRATPGPGVNLGTNGAGQQAMQGEQSPYSTVQGSDFGAGRMLGTNGFGQFSGNNLPNMPLGGPPIHTTLNQQLTPDDWQRHSAWRSSLNNNMRKALGPIFSPNMLGTNGMGQRATQVGGMNPYSAISQAGSLGKQFNPYGTGMGFNGGLGGGLSGSSVGNNMGQAAGTNAAAVPGANQMKLGADQPESGAALDTKPSDLSYVPGIGGLLSSLVKKTPGVNRGASILGEGGSGFLGSMFGAPAGAVGGTFVGSLLPALLSKKVNMLRNSAIGAGVGGNVGALTGSSLGTHAGSSLFRHLAARPEAEKQSAEKAAFAALKNLLQRFAKPGVAAKSVGENIPEAVGEATRYLKPRYPLPEAKNLLPGFLDDMNASIPKPRLGVPTQQPYKAQDLASLGHDYSKLDSRPRSLSGDNLPVLGKLLKKRYPLPEATDLMPGYLDDMNASIPKPRLGVPTQRPYKAEDFASIGHDYSKLTSPGGDNLPIIGKMAAEKQSAEKAAFAALKNLLQRFAKPGVAAKSVGEEAAAALSAPVGRRPRLGVPNVDAAESALKPRYSLPEAKNLVPEFLADINSSIPKPRLGSPTQQPYRAQDLASIGHDYSKLKSLGGENLPIIGKMLKRRYPLPEARDLRPEFWEGNRNFNPRFGLPVVEGELKAIGHDYRDMSKNLPGSPLPIVGKMAADQLGKLAAGRCWEGYEPVPGKKPYSDGSCQPKGEKSKAKEKKAFAALEREYNAMQSGLTGADLGMRIVPGALAGGVVGGVKGLMEDPGYDDRTGKKRSRLVNILKNSLGGAVGGGVVGHLMGAPAMQFGVRKGYELGDGISRYLSDARDRVEKLSADKRASLGKLLAGGGIGGALGTLLGRYTGYNAGYNKGSSIGEHESLLNLLRGMHGVMRQGAESNLDLKELVNKKASSGCGCGSGKACQCGDDQNNRASKCSECGEINCQCQKSASDVAFLGKMAAAQEKLAFRLLPVGRHD